MVGIDNGNTPFEKYVDVQKRQRLENNFSETFVGTKGPVPQTVADYLALADVVVSPESVKNAECLATGQETNAIVPDIPESDMYKILENAPTKFSDPLSLAQYVSDLIKQNMSYNGIDMFLLVRGRVVNAPERLNKAIVHDLIVNLRGLISFDMASMERMYSMHTRDEIIQYVSEMLGNSNLTMSDQQLRSMQQFSEAKLGLVREKYFDLLHHGSFDGKTADDVLADFETFETAVKTKDYTKINSLIMGNKLLLSVVRGELLGEKYDLCLFKQHTVEEYLYNIHTGVCRHYSLIAKRIYEKLKDRIDPPMESEMIYVANMGKRHAYNLLMWSDPNEADPSKYHQQYIDITNYNPVEKKTLYKSPGEKGVYGDPGEIWASTADGNEQSVDRSI